MPDTARTSPQKPLAGPVLSVLRRQRGHLPGLAPAGLLIRFDTGDQPVPDVQSLQQRRERLIDRLCMTPESLESLLPISGDDGWQSAADAAMQIVVAIQKQARLSLPASACCRLLQPGSYLLYQPATEFSGQAVFALLKLVVAALLESDHGSFETRLWPQMQNALEFFRAALPVNVNTLRFLSAAQRLNVPVRMITDMLGRYGWGCNSQLMDSSLTEQTSAIGCKFARNKLLAKELLKSAGLPVAPGLVVGSADAAWQAARSLGLPVVVKPQSADGGEQVHVRLFTQQEVEQAAQSVIAAGHHVLVEVWKPGRDYRLQVFRDSVFRCIERTPGGVVGDGIQSIASLVEQLNREPDRGPLGSGKRRRPIDLDLDAERTLAQQGLAIDSVPPAGHFVALRSAANVARGGEMHAVLDQAHPDNLDLAVRAVTAMRLDLAGVDILMSDIRRSWLEVGAVICEVNAQPQMATHHEAVLQGLLHGDGRIPIDVVVGFERLGPRLGLDAASAVTGAGSGTGLGLVCRDGVFVDGCCYDRAPEDQFAAIATLLACTRVSRLVIAVWQTSLFTDGLPFDRFDRLISLAPPAEAALTQDPGPARTAQVLVALLSQMAGRCLVFDSEEALIDSLVEDGSIPAQRRQPMPQTRHQRAAI